MPLGSFVAHSVDKYLDASDLEAGCLLDRIAHLGNDAAHDRIYINSVRNLDVKIYVEFTVYISDKNTLVGNIGAGHVAKSLRSTGSNHTYNPESALSRMTDKISKIILGKLYSAQRIFDFNH